MNTSRISIPSGIIAISVAVVIDFLQLFLDVVIIGLILDSIITVFAGIGFGTWFSVKDVSVMSNDRALKFLGTLLVEFLPAVDGVVPAWTIFVASTVINEWWFTAGL